VIAQQLVNGIVVGAEYALFAVGLVLIFGVLRVVNFAHGALFAAGSVAGIVAFQHVGVTAIGDGLVAGVAIGAAGAAAIQLLIMIPLNWRPKVEQLTPAVATVGFSWITVGLLTVWVGADPISYPDRALPTTGFKIGGVLVRLMDLVVILMAILILLALDWIIANTRAGRQIRAVAHDSSIAALVGVRPSRVRAYVMLGGGAFAGLAGALTTFALDNASPYQGDSVLMRGFAIIVLGGMGSVRGAMFGGFALGIAEALGTAAGYSQFRNVVPVAILFAVLMIRPAGLFGRHEVERA
jgi:branched-chain amino acid transport system permease protein